MLGAKEVFVGIVDGMEYGRFDGTVEDIVLGTFDGFDEGTSIGRLDLTDVGCTDACVGAIVGVADGD